MSVDSIRSSVARALSNNSRLTLTELRNIVSGARDNGDIDTAERAELSALLATYSSRFTVAARSEFARLVGPLTGQPTTRPVPTSPELATREAARQPWTTTYWPYSAFPSRGDTGTATHHLWAPGGPLAKFDDFLTAKGLSTGAREHELLPNLNWLVGKQAGYYVPNDTVNERDAERTTGVDFNNNGKIDANVQWDFIDSTGAFRKDGKTDSSLGVGWWGSCDKVARAGILFEEPKRDVTLNGVTFTKQDIKGLLTLIADSQGGGTDFIGNRYDKRFDTVALKTGEQINGTLLSALDFPERGREDWSINSTALPDEVRIRLIDGTERTFPKSQISYVAREDKRDDPVLMHETINEWLASGRPAVMDKDSGDHVWNYNFHRADDKLYKDGLKPFWASDELLQKGYRGPAGDGTITFVERTVVLGSAMGDESVTTETYRYWLEEKNGTLVNGGWQSQSSPDFLWRPQSAAQFSGRNDRNPFVDPKLVKEIYEASIA